MSQSFITLPHLKCTIIEAIATFFSMKVVGCPLVVSGTSEVHQGVNLPEFLLKKFFGLAFNQKFFILF